MTDKEMIDDLERRLAEETRRADIAEAWQERLTTLLAQSLMIQKIIPGTLTLPSQQENAP